MKDVSNVIETHRKAMFLAQDAMVLEAKGDPTSAIPLYEEAFHLEKQAAMALFHSEDKEPMRSVLFRSAASLALNCKLWREAEKMIACGLSGNPPYEIAEELRQLYNTLPSLRPLESPSSDKSTKPKFDAILVVVGTFKMADAEKNFIKIIDTTEKSIAHQKIEVPKGLGEIVKMYFDELVQVKLRKRTNKIYELLDIEKYKVSVQ